MNLSSMVHLAKYRAAEFLAWTLFQPQYFECEDGFLPDVFGDAIVSHLRSSGFEDPERNFLRTHLNRFGAFIDVGANIGVYTLLASKHLGDPRTVLSFEASPREFRKLKMTIAKNQLLRVRARNVALSDRDESVDIFESIGGGGALNKIGAVPKNEGIWAKRKIRSERLDSIVFGEGAPALSSDRNRPVFLKIDVEGFELPVLRGASRVLNELRPMIMIEMNEARSLFYSSPEAVWQELEDLEYAWYGLDEETLGLVPLGTLKEARSINLFALHPESRCSDEMSFAFIADKTI